MFDFSLLKFGGDGLIPVITQDYLSKEVLMLAYMNKESLQKTFEGGLMCYYSRSKSKLWLKGETSGHYQKVVSASYDCDADTLLFLVKQEGAACHTGNYSCFYRKLEGFGEANAQTNIAYSSNTDIFETLMSIIKDRRENPKEGSYTNYLFDKGLDKILKKVGEETSEVIIAAKNTDNTELANEAADLIYHLSVLFAQAGLEWERVKEVLAKRHK